MDSLLNALRRFDALRDEPNGQADYVATRIVPNREPTFAEEQFIATLPSAIQQALAKEGIKRLYRHQAEAITRIRSGSDVVIESPTASGKTLCFNIPVVSRLVEEPQSHALMLFPMKALANDQRRQLEALGRETGAMGTRRVDSWIYDGDTPQEERNLMRRNPPAILLTNPEMLHLTFLGWSEQWEGFLRRLKFIIIDEIHEYRGFFGTNFALLLRRFLSLVQDLGACPQLILATATCANPLEHAERLTGRKFTLIKGDDQRPTRHYAFVGPAIPDYRYFDVYRLRVARAALASASLGYSTIVFCPSRKFAEEATRIAKLDAEGFGVPPACIEAYRAGYTSEDRRRIEAGLREGTTKVVFSTNALEIGIDIGKLDTCILAGFPDNVMAARQRIGRSGRAWDRTAYVLFYALNDAVDQFFLHNIDAFLDHDLDEIIVGVDNEELLGKHLPFALHELGWRVSPTKEESLGTALYERVRDTLDRGRGPINGVKPPYGRLSIRGASGSVSKLLYRGEEIGEISDVHLFREAYIGAIYVHQGKSYRVQSHGAGEVYLEDAQPHQRTEPSFFTVVSASEVLDAARWRGAVTACYGKLQIVENFGGYKLVDERTGEVLEEHPEANAKWRNVRAFWLGIEDSAFLATEDIQPGMQAIEQFIRIGSPFIIPCDRHDVGTLSTVKLPVTVYFYETVPGGIGVAEKAFHVWRTLVEKGVSLAERCVCKEGCPRCILPRRPRDAADLRKSVGIAFAQALLTATDAVPEDVFDPETGGFTPNR